MFFNGHETIISLFIPFIYYHSFRFKPKTFIHVFIFSIIAILFSLPYGLYNYKVNGLYVFSSNGAGYQFYLGNTEAGYKTIVDVPEKNSVEFENLEDITNNAGIINKSPERYKFIMAKPQSLKQTYFFKDAITWIKANPFKTFVLNLRHFNILVGPNNAGKSTILAAFRILAAAIRKASTRTELVPVVWTG